MSIRITAEVKGALAWRSRTSSAVDKIVLMAGSSALRAMRVEANKLIRARKAVKLPAINRVITLSAPSNGRKQALLWSMRVDSAAMPVAGYPHRQTAKGVSIQVNAGSRSLIKHAFIATMRSGHRGVFMRYGTPHMAPVQSYRGHARYAGQKRQPIRELFSTQIRHVFDDDGFVPALYARARSEYERTMTRLMAARAKG